MFGIVPTSWTPVIQSALRIVAAVSFITHGTQKLFALPSGGPGSGAVELMSQMGLAGVLEMFGGLLMLVGLFSRPTAFILAGEMAVAYFLAHVPQGVWPILNGGELASLYCFIWLFFAAAGPGPLSLDALFNEPRSRNRYR